MNELRRTGMVYLPSEIQHVRFDGARKDVHAAVPDMFKQFPARDDTSRVPHQYFEQGKFFSCEVYGAFAAAHRLATHVE